MKQAALILITTIALTACSPSPKKLSTVERGMNKSEVVLLVGEPRKKNVINHTEVWDYPDSARTVIFRKDTVYAVITSAKARIDSIARWIGETDNTLKKGLDNAGDALKKAGKKVDSSGRELGKKLN